MLGRTIAITGKILSSGPPELSHAGRWKKRLLSASRPLQSSIRKMAHQRKRPNTASECLQFAKRCLYRTYPRLTLRLRAPVEIENLLPFDIRFRIYDKNREHNWSSFLRRGGTSPLHMAELSHLLLLSVEIQDSREYPAVQWLFKSDVNRLSCSLQAERICDYQH